MRLLQRVAPLAFLSTCVAGCDFNQGAASPESKRLEREVVPRLVAWERSKSQELELKSLAALQGFDYLCVMWQYRPYDTIEEEIGPVDVYRGTKAGFSVPENELALIGVRSGVAYVAHMRAGDFTMGGGGRHWCAPLKDARFVRRPTPVGGEILAVLDGGQ